MKHISTGPFAHSVLVMSISIITNTYCMEQMECSDATKPPSIKEAYRNNRRFAQPKGNMQPKTLFPLANEDDSLLLPNNDSQLAEITTLVNNYFVDISSIIKFLSKKQSVDLFKKLYTLTKNNTKIEQGSREKFSAHKYTSNNEHIINLKKTIQSSYDPNRSHHAVSLISDLIMGLPDKKSIQTFICSTVSLLEQRLDKEKISASAVPDTQDFSQSNLMHEDKAFFEANFSQKTLFLQSCNPSSCE